MSGGHYLGQTDQMCGILNTTVASPCIGDRLALASSATTKIERPLNQKGHQTQQAHGNDGSHPDGDEAIADPTPLDMTSVLGELQSVFSQVNSGLGHPWSWQFTPPTCPRGIIGAPVRYP